MRSGLNVDPGGKDSEAWAVVLGGGRGSASTISLVQVKHQPRDESDGNAGYHIEYRSVPIVPTTYQLVKVQKLPVMPTL